MQLQLLQHNSSSQAESIGKPFTYLLTTIDISGEMFYQYYGDAIEIVSYLGCCEP